MCVCVVCVLERERERESVYAYACMCVYIGSRGAMFDTFVYVNSVCIGVLFLLLFKLVLPRV